MKPLLLLVQQDAATAAAAIATERCNCLQLLLLQQDAGTGGRCRSLQLLQLTFQDCLLALQNVCEVIMLLDHVTRSYGLIMLLDRVTAS